MKGFIYEAKLEDLLEALGKDRAAFTVEGALATKDTAHEAQWYTYSDIRDIILNRFENAMNEGFAAGAKEIQ